jgi:hypothetical protein
MQSWRAHECCCLLSLARMEFDTNKTFGKRALTDLVAGLFEPSYEDFVQLLYPYDVNA